MATAAPDSSARTVVLRAFGGRSAGGLAVLAALSFVAAISIAYVHGTFLTSSGFADHATSALDEKAVRADIADGVNEAVALSLGVGTADVEGEVGSAVKDLVRSKSFHAAFRAGAKAAHRAVFELDRNAVDLTLPGAGGIVREAVQGVSPELAAQIDPSADLTVERVDPPSWLPKLLRLADAVSLSRFLFFALAIGFGVWAFTRSTDRRRTATYFGAATAVSSLGVFGGLLLAKGVATAGVEGTVSSAAAAGIWDAFLGGLMAGLVVVAAVAAFVAIAARLSR